MSDFEPHGSEYWERNYRELRSKVRDWFNRLEKEMQNAPSYIFKDSTKIVKEMEKELNTP